MRKSLDRRLQMFGGMGPGRDGGTAGRAPLADPPPQDSRMTVKHTLL